ncbi:MAG: peptidase MA family metallohydrolase, partial [Anaerolineae bacterium]
ATFAFGQSMDFSLTAASADVIEAATLFISAPDLPNTLTAVLPITPGRQISANYELDLTQVRLAPFTTVTYWWRLETAVGEISLDQQTIIYEDDQFSWRQAAQDGVVVHWTGDDAGLGQLGLDIVDESLPRLAAILPVPDPLAVDIYIYPSSADLRSALRLTGRDWVGAHAHPELGVVLVTAVNSRTAAADLRQSIPHELTHFLLYQAAGPHYDSIPAWFGEGLATFVEDSAHPNYDALLATAVAQQTTIPFTELCQAFPAVEQRALLAYAQSASFIDYLQGRFGGQALRELTAAYTDGMDCQSGISHVLQKSLTDLNQDWLRHEQPLSPFRQFWRDNGYWLLLLTGGFGLASLLIIKPRRKNQR